MEDRRAQHGVGARLADRLAQVLAAARAARGDHGDVDRVRDRAGQLELVAVLGAVAVHAREEDLPRPPLGPLACPLDRVAPRRHPPAVHVDLVAAVLRRPLASIASTTHCAPNVSASSEMSSGRATAAEFTDTLSAPASSTACASSPERMPPPIVNGMKTLSAVRRASCTIVSRCSCEAVMSRNTSSSAPSAS